jgi:hypothetical protein
LSKSQNKKEKAMKNFSGICIGLALGFWMLAGTPAVYAEADDSIISEEGRSRASDADFQGPFEEVFMQDDAGESDSSAFEGDSDDMPGERAPENMPMDDAPVDAGLGFEV